MSLFKSNTKAAAKPEMKTVYGSVDAETEIKATKLDSKGQAGVIKLNGETGNLAFTEDGFTEERKHYPLSFAFSHIAKWDRFCVAFFDQNSGKVTSSQVVFINGTIRAQIAKAADQRDCVLKILAARKACEGKTIKDAYYVREPVALTDPQSGKLYGCNIIVAV